MDRIHMDNCEGCKRALFESDLVHAYDDGPTLCEGCAPTFDECKIEYDGFVKEGIAHEVFGTQADADLVIDFVNARIAEGKGSHKHVWTLGKDIKVGSQ